MTEPKHPFLKLKKPNRFQEQKTAGITLLETMVQRFFRAITRFAKYRKISKT
jgi:hypothetical protein